MKNIDRSIKRIHILFTGVGRRVELLQIFRQAGLALNVELKIYGADVLDTAPALVYCDVVRRVCGMREEGYIDELLSICKRDKINLLIPTIDTDLLLLSKAIDKFENIGTKVLVSSNDKINLCRNKNLTSIFFEQCGLRTPYTCNDYKLYNNKYPCFIKPKDGSSSINAFKVNNPTELEMYAEKIDDYVIQPFIEGTEYTVDVFCDFLGNPIYVTPRIRCAVRAGEVLKTKIVLDEGIIGEVKQLIEKFKPCGPITIQLIKDRETEENYYIEINPRYGGGVPLSMKAGAKSAEAVLMLLLGESLDYCKNVCNDKAVYSRFDQSVCIDRGIENQAVRGVIFDLDDTLYSEKEYVQSGYHKIAELLGDISVEEKLWKYFLEGKPAIDSCLSDLGMQEKRDKCIEAYREHMPDIRLYDGVLEIIEYFKTNDIRVGIITDGRIDGQHNKITALKLDKMIDDIIITDELGGVQFRKPNDISFRIMQNRWRLPFEQMVYVGDNPLKDFIAPMQLGMQVVWYQNSDGLYYKNEYRNDKIKTFKQMLDFFEWIKKKL